MKNNLITIKAEKNGLLPTADVYAFYGGSGLGGQANPNAISTGGRHVHSRRSRSGYGTVVGNMFNNSSPD